ncbi:hypothetical protein [Sulfurimonas sp.]
MQHIIECQKVRSKVTALKALHNNLVALATQTHGIRIFGADDCKNRQILSITQLNYKTTAVDFHPSQNICAIANNKIIYIISLSNKSILQTIHTNNGTIQILRFVPNLPYLVTGTAEGRVMLYRYDQRWGLSRLVSFPHIREKRKISNNYVSAFAFSQNYVACSGHGGCIKLIHLNSHKHTQVFCNSKVRINALCFSNEEKLLFGNVDGTVYIQSLKNRTKSETINMPFANIKNIIHFEHSDFAIISGQSNNISLIHIRTAKIITPKYLSFKDEVHTMTLTKEQNLIIVLKNNQIYHIKFATAQDLRHCILRKNLQKAFEIIDADPRLQDTKEHKRVEALYEKLYANALNALIESDKAEVKKTIEIIKNIHTKTEDIALLHKAYENYPKFKSLYLEKKYALAYNLSNKLPPLKYTPQYKKMEDAFKEAFTFAQKQILLGRQDVAKEILHPYITVLSKRTLVNLLLKQNKEFLEFLKALQNKDFKKIYSLVSQNEIFKEIPTYIALEKSQETLLKNIGMEIDKAKIDEAIQQIKALKDSPYKKNELEELYDYALCAKKLLTAYEENDFKKCYELIDEDERLQQLEISKLLEKHWQKLMHECENYALQGDIQGIKETLDELITITTRTQKTGDLLRLSFYTKIKQLIQKNKFKSTENIIYSYIDIFGIDKELREIMKHYETYTLKKLAITHEQEKKRERDAWIYSKILMNS